jgi:hypothetical protein
MLGFKNRMIGFKNEKINSQVECLFPRTVSTNFTRNKEMFGPRVEKFVPGSKGIEKVGIVV